MKHPLSLCVVVISSLLLSIQELSATQQSPNDTYQLEVQGFQQEKITLITMKDNKNLFQTMAQIAVGQKQYDDFFPVLFEKEQGWGADKLINLPKNHVSHMQAMVLYDEKDKTKPEGVYISGAIPSTDRGETSQEETSTTSQQRSNQEGRQDEPINPSTGQNNTPTTGTYQHPGQQPQYQQPIIEEVDENKEETKEEETSLMLAKIDKQMNNDLQVSTNNTSNNNSLQMQMQLAKANQNLEVFKKNLSRSIATGFNNTMQLNQQNLQNRLRKLKAKNQGTLDMYKTTRRMSRQGENQILQKHTSGNPKDFNVAGFFEDAKKITDYRISESKKIREEEQKNKQQNIQDNLDMTKSYLNNINTLSNNFEERARKMMALRSQHTDHLYKLAQQRLELINKKESDEQNRQYTKQKNDLDVEHTQKQNEIEQDKKQQQLEEQQRLFGVQQELDQIKIENNQRESDIKEKKRLLELKAKQENEELQKRLRDMQLKKEKDENNLQERLRKIKLQQINEENRRREEQNKSTTYSGSDKAYDTNVSYQVEVKGDGKITANFRLIYYSSSRTAFRLELEFKDGSGSRLTSWMTPDIELYNLEDTSKFYNFNIPSDVAIKTKNVTMVFRWARNR